MWEEIFGYPVEQASEEKLWEEYNLPDDSFVQHALGMAALMELVRRGLVENPFEKIKKGIDTIPKL